MPRAFRTHRSSKRRRLSLFAISHIGIAISQYFVCTLTLYLHAEYSHFTRSRVRRRALLALRAFALTDSERSSVFTKSFAEKLVECIGEDPDPFVAAAALSLALTLVDVGRFFYAEMINASGAYTSLVASATLQRNIILPTKISRVALSLLQKSPSGGSSRDVTLRLAALAVLGTSTQALPARYGLFLSGVDVFCLTCRKSFHDLIFKAVSDCIQYAAAFKTPDHGEANNFSQSSLMKAHLVSKLYSFSHFEQFRRFLPRPSPLCSNLRILFALSYLSFPLRCPIIVTYF